MMKPSIFVFAIALAGAGLSAPVLSTELVVNGGFEAGLDDWSSRNVSVTSTHLGVSAFSGSSMAVAGVSGTEPADADVDAYLFQTISFDTGGVGALELSFAYNLQALDVTRFVDSGSDALGFFVNPVDNPVDNLAGYIELFSVSFNDIFDSGQSVQSSTILGWTLFSQTYSDIPDVGVVNLSFAFGVQNTAAGSLSGDEGQLFAAYIDDVSVRIVAAPASVLLFGLGLVAVGLQRRCAVLAAVARML